MPRLTSRQAPIPPGFPARRGPASRPGRPGERVPGLWVQCSTARLPAPLPLAPPAGLRQAGRCWGPRAALAPAWRACSPRELGGSQQSTGRSRHLLLAGPLPTQFQIPKSSVHSAPPPPAIRPFPAGPQSPLRGGTHRAAGHVGAGSLPTPDWCSRVSSAPLPAGLCQAAEGSAGAAAPGPLAGAPLGGGPATPELAQVCRECLAGGRGGGHGQGQGVTAGTSAPRACGGGQHPSWTHSCSCRLQPQPPAGPAAEAASWPPGRSGSSPGCVLLRSVRDTLGCYLTPPAALPSLRQVCSGMTQETPRRPSQTGAHMTSRGLSLQG